MTTQVPDEPVGAIAVADDPAEEAAATGTADPATASQDTTTTNGLGDPPVAAEAAPAVEPDAPVDAEASTEEAPAAVTEAAVETETDAPEAPESVAEAEPESVSATAPEAAAAPMSAAEPEASAEPESPSEPEAAAAEAEAATAEPEAGAEPAPTSSHVDEAAAEADTPVETPDEPPALPAPPRELGPEPTTMEELLAEQDTDIKSFKHGDVVEGNVVRIDKDEILVDIGAKSEGVVSNRELFGRHGEGQTPLNIGDTVLVYVLQPESPEGHAVLSLRRAGLERKWRAMQEQFEAGVIIEAPVIDHNKGGLIVDCGIRGFVPISQIVDFPRRPQNDQPRDAAQEIAEKLQPFVGRKLRLKILEVNRKANRLILSEKVALYEERREKRDELFSSLQVGQKVSGTVRSIAPFGVFIDLGGIDGLVHKSELSWNKVNNPEAGYKVGDEVEAEVIDINHERGRISLSIRRLQPDPWHSTVADFKVGDIIDGTVTKLVNFGAFVRVRDGLEGLIHISELSHQRVAHPGDVVHEGQQLKLKIISLDSERHRLGLSLKQAEEPPARPAPEPGAPRAERRPRQERGYSMSDAIQEPEGGIDNTLASAFAQVREQLAAAEVTDVVEAVVETEAAEEAVAAEAIEEVTATVVADELAVEDAAAGEIDQIADAAAANDANEEPAAEAVAEVTETVAAAEAEEEAVAAEAVEEIVEAVAADEAAVEAEAIEAVEEIVEAAADASPAGDESPAAADASNTNGKAQEAETATAVADEPAETAADEPAETVADEPTETVEAKEAETRSEDKPADA